MINIPFPKLEKSFELSFYMIGNILMKLIIGVLSDRIGAIRSCVVMIITNIFSLLMIYSRAKLHIRILMLAGAFLFGSVYAVGAVGIALVCREAFGNENFGKAYPKLSFLISMGSASSITSDEITGAHNITIKTDFVLSEKLTDYDMIILPGGYGGVEEMMNCNTLLDTLNDMHSSGQYIAAICAAPLVLDKAGLLKGKNFTCYPSVNKKISSGSRLDDKKVIDDTLITSQGPAKSRNRRHKSSGRHAYAGKKHRYLHFLCRTDGTDHICYRK